MASSYQKNLAKFTQMNANKPKTDLIDDVAYIYQFDKKSAIGMANELTKNGSFQFNNPYSKPTNRAVGNLQALGLNVDKVDDDWFKQNSWLQQHYTFDGTSNNPTKPGKRASAEQVAAYEYYQLWKAEEKTKKAENEWAAMQEELNYWANRRDRNYSDGEILDRIDWTKYPTLAEMDKQKEAGLTLEFNRPINYSREAVEGALWAARNDGGSGNTYLDAAMSRLGYGKKWQENPEITAKLDATSDTYSPYSVGSTLEEEGLYFGMDNFPKNWVEKNAVRVANSNDETEKRMFQNVAEAEERTRDLEDSLADMDAAVEQMVKNGYTEDAIVRNLKGNQKYSNLFELDKTIARNGVGLVGTTRPIDYSWNSMEAKIRELVAKKEAEPTLMESTQMTIAAMSGSRNPVSVRPETNPADTISGAAAGAAAGRTPTGTGDNNIPMTEPPLPSSASVNAAGETEEEQTSLSGTAASERVETRRQGLVPSMPVPQAVSAGGKEAGTVGLGSAAGSAIMSAVPSTVNLAQEQERIQQKNLNEATPLIMENGTHEEQLVFDSGKSVGFSAAAQAIAEAPANEKACNDAIVSDVGHVTSTDWWGSASVMNSYKKAEASKAEKEDRLEFVKRQKAILQAKKQASGGVTGYEIDMVNDVLDDPEFEQYGILNMLKSSDPNEQYDGYDALSVLMARRGLMLDTNGKGSSPQRLRDIPGVSIENIPEQIRRFGDLIVEASDNGGLDNPGTLSESDLNMLSRWEEEESQLEDEIDNIDIYLEDNQDAYNQASVARNNLYNYYAQASALTGDENLSSQAIIDIERGVVAADGEWMANDWSDTTTWNSYYDMELEALPEYIDEHIDDYQGMSKEEAYDAEKDRLLAYTMQNASQTVLEDQSCVASLQRVLNNPEIQLTDKQRENIEQEIRVRTDRMKKGSYFLMQNMPGFRENGNAAIQEAMDKKEEYSDLTRANMAALLARSAGGQMYAPTSSLINYDPELLTALFAPLALIAARETAEGTQSKEFLDQFFHNNEKLLLFGQYGQKQRNTADQIMHLVNDDEIWTYFELLVNDGQDAANDYFQFLVSDGTGMAAIRNQNDISGKTRDAIEAGGAATALGLTYTFFLKPAADIEGTLYRAEGDILGKQTSPKSASYQNMQFVKDARDASLNLLHNTVSDSEVLDTLFNAFVSLDDSQWNSILVGEAVGLAGSAANGLMKSASSPAGKFVKGKIEALTKFWDKARKGEIGGKASRLLKFASNSSSEIAHATFMGLGAATEAMRDAQIRNMPPEAQKAIFVATFLAESVTEGIRFGHFSRAIDKSTSGAFFHSLKEFFLDPEALAELVGEGINQYIEDEADKIYGKELSNYNAIYQEYLKQYPRSVAEEYANQQMVKNVLIAAISGYLTGGATSTISNVTGMYYNTKMETAQQAIAARDLGLVNRTEREAIYNRTKEIAGGFWAEVFRNASKDNASLNSRVAERNAGNAAVAVSAVLRSSNESNLADAAAQHIVTDVAGGSAVTAVTMARGMVTASEQDLAQMKEAVAFAALTDGNANQALTRIADKAKSGIMITHQDVTDLIEAAALDREGEENQKKFNAMIREKVTENRTASQVRDLIATGRFNTALKAAQENVREKQAKLADATAKRDDAIANRDSIAENVQAAVEEHLENPTNDSNASVEQSSNQLLGADTVVQQEEDSVQKAQEEVEQAQEEETRKTDEVLTEVRQEAAQTVAEQQAQEELEEAQRLEQEAQDAKVLAARQAEIDKQNGKAWEDNRDAVIDKMLDEQFFEEGERREARRKELEERANMIRAGKINMAGMMNNSEGILAVGMLGRRLGVDVKLTNDESILPKEAAGKYVDGTVYLNSNLIESGKMTVGQAVMEVAMHEFTHYMEGTRQYSKYSQTVMDFLFQGENAGARMDAAIDSKIQDYREKFGQELTRDEAKAEIVADFAKNRLNDRDVMQRFLDKGIAGKVRNALHNINQAIQNFKLTGQERETAEYLRKTERMYQKMIEEAARSEVHPDGGQFSIAQLADAAGLEFNENTLEMRTPDGEIIDGVTPGRMMTPDMLQNTPIGMLIRLAENGMANKRGKTVFASTISHETAQAQMQMFSDLANMAAQYRDSDLVWEIASSTLFSAMKSNSDPQYSTTVDFGTICAKTQEIINVMSRVMLEKGRGLTREEVLAVYNETANAGLTVPCPVCYVFSRWMGVPSLLNQMSEYQKRFVITNEDNSINVAKTQEAANEYIKSALSKYGDKEGIDNAKTRIMNKLKTQEKKRVEALKVITSETATEEEKAAAQKKHADAIEKMDALDKELGEVEAFNWVTQALCKQERKGQQVFNVLDADGNYVVDSDFEITPDDVLFDLRRTGDFAKFTKNWSYRNTRGAGMGKAIMPYSGMSIGDVVYGTDRRMASANPFLIMDPKTAANGMKDAAARVLKQNLIGGQRLQSTSDFRPEWGLDYMMTFLELQAIGSKVQMYTKVAEAVPLLASMGADINLSIMGKGKGWHVDENGNYVLDFSDVTGMNYETAKALKDQHSNVQMILVGMNDTHIRLALADSDIDFVIPWHSSGNSKDTLSSLVSSASIGQEQLETSSDYTETQSDKASDNQTPEQKNLWDLRMKILQGKKINAAERETIYTDPYLKNLYERFNVEGKDADCYKVKLGKEQAKQIFPYEYWDKSLTKGQADENGRRFVEYCQHFGLTPRFSGTVRTAEKGKYFTQEEIGDGKPIAYDSEGRVTKYEQNNFAGAVYDENGNITGYDPSKMDQGYWKTLIDRPMYDNDGNYRDQQVVDVTKARIGSIENGKLTNSDMPLTTSAMYGPNYSEQEKNAVDNSLAAINEQEDLRAAQRSGQFSDGGTSLTDLDMWFDDYVENLSASELDELSQELFGIPLSMPSDAQTVGDQTSQQQEAKDDAVEQLLANVNEAYTEALESGDLTTARKIIDKLAEKNGYTFYGTHRTNAEFTVFDRSKQTGKNGKTLGDGFYVAKGENTEYDSDTYGKNRMLVYVKPGNVFNLQEGGLSEEQARKVYEKYFAPLHPLANDAYDESNPYTSHVIAQLQKSYKVMDYIKEAAENANTTTDTIFKELGYNSIKDGPQYVVFDPDQIKSFDLETRDENGRIDPDRRFTNNADIRYSDGGTSLTDLDQQLVDSGIVSQGDIDQFNANQPEQQGTDLPKAYRQFGRYTAQTNDDLDQSVKDYLYNNSIYTPETNAAQVDRAIEWVRSHANEQDQDGYRGAMAEVEDPDFDFRGADGQARMLTLMSMAAVRAQNGDQNALNDELRLADAFNRQGTYIGREMQARKMFRLMTPIGRQAVLQRMADDINEQYGRQGSNRRVGLSEWTMRAAGEAQSEEDFSRVRHAAAQELAEQMPANWKEKLTSWRMLSMLGNPRTHIRNIMGNAMFMPAVGLKNKIGALMELGLDKENRTKTLGLASQEARAFAKKDVQEVRDLLTGDAKYNEGNAVQQERKTWGQGDSFISKSFGKALQAVSDLNSNALEYEDWIFLQRHYRNSLAGYMTARGLTEADMTGTTLDEARAYAINEAQKATYRDANKIAELLNKMGKQNGVVGFITNAVLPFKKTPANILRRGIEYSPAGIIKSLTLDAHHLKQYMDYQNGKLDALPEKAISPSQWIDKVSSGLTGTGVTALGFLLASLGVIRCGFGDDDDMFEQLRGRQEYSLELLGQSVTIDWAAPMSMPLFVGASMYENAQKLSDGEFDVEGAVESLLNITEPVFNLSMLDGVNSLLDISSYDSSGIAIAQVLEKIGLNYATSYVPTLAGQFARTIDTTRRKNFVESGVSPWVSQVLYSNEKTENKIPFLSRSNIPYRNVWGDTDESSTVGAALENFLSPAYINELKNDAVVDELQRLYNTVSDDNKSATMPKMPGKTVNIEGERTVLTAEQYDELTKERGQTARSMLEELMSRPEYTLADDETKAVMIKDVWTYATQRANGIVTDGKSGMDDWVSTTVLSGSDPVNAVINRSIELNYKIQVKAYSAELNRAVSAMDMESTQTSIAALRRAGMADSSIKSAITKQIKPAYRDAYLKGDRETMLEIETMLEDLDENIKYTQKDFNNWVKDIKKDEE